MIHIVSPSWKTSLMRSLLVLCASSRTNEERSHLLKLARTKGKAVTESMTEAFSRPDAWGSPRSFRKTREGVQSSTRESASIEFLEVKSTKRSVPKPEQKVHPKMNIFSFFFGAQKVGAHPCYTGREGVTMGFGLHEGENGGNADSFSSNGKLVAICYINHFLLRKNCEKIVTLLLNDPLSLNDLK